jgi:hypothetical protein
MKIGLPTSSLGHLALMAGNTFVDHEFSHHVSCDRLYGFRNQVSTDTANSLITSHSRFICDKWKTVNPTTKNTISVPKPWPSNNTQEHESRDVILILTSPMGIIFFG